MSDWTESLPLDKRRKARRLQEERAAALRAWDGRLMTRDRAREIVALCNARLEKMAREV